jgi:hypothetical protein
LIEVPGFSCSAKILNATNDGKIARNPGRCSMVNARTPTILANKRADQFVKVFALKGLPGSNRGPDTRGRDICARVNIGIKVAVVVIFHIFHLPKGAPLIHFLVCRVSNRYPNTSRFTWRVAKHQKLLSVLGSSRKQIPISLLRRLGSEFEPTDFYLIRARKRAQLVGLDRS